MQPVLKSITSMEDASILSAPRGAQARAEANKRTVLDFYQCALNQSRFRNAMFYRTSA